MTIGEDGANGRSVVDKVLKLTAGVDEIRDVGLSIVCCSPGDVGIDETFFDLR